MGVLITSLASLTPLPTSPHHYPSLGFSHIFEHDRFSYLQVFAGVVSPACFFLSSVLRLNVTFSKRLFLTALSK